MGDKRSLSTARSSDGTYSIIMQKFRPIAPKPATADGKVHDIPSCMLPRKPTNGRVKGKYKVRVRRGRPSKKENNTSLVATDLPNEDESSNQRELVTLQLLPERSEQNCWDFDKSSSTELYRSIKSSQREHHYDIHALPTLPKQCNLQEQNPCDDFIGSGITSSWIIVECISETSCMSSGVELGISDNDKINHLQMDTCPGFVSDGSNNVVWINQAYKKMMMMSGQENEEYKVWLILKENMPFQSPAFACRITHHYMRNGQKCSRTVPCDVWRMKFGGFAWKLDIRAALGLAI